MQPLSGGGYHPIPGCENGDLEDEDEVDAALRRGGASQGGSWLEDLTEHLAFQMVMGTIIATNAAVIGLETDHPRYWMWPKLEDAFLVAFVAELSLRLVAFGFSGFFSSSNPDIIWNCFDFCIVIVGCVDRACTSMLGKNSKTGSAKIMGMLMRCFRLMRILRIFRIFRVLKQLYLLATGFVDAVLSSLWVTTLAAMILYICAVVLTRLVGMPDETDPLAAFKEGKFGSIGASMLTLFQLMAYPDMEKFEPLYRESWGFLAFLVTFVIFGSFTVVSILTGVISESMLERSKHQQEERRADQERSRSIFVRAARKVMQSADERGQGMLGRSQFDRCAGEVLRLCREQYLDIRPRDLEAMFELVDYQGNGVIEIEELLYGMVQLSTEVRPMSIMELRRVLHRGLHGTGQRMAALEARLLTMDARLCELVAASRANAAASAWSSSAPPASPPLPPPAAAAPGTSAATAATLAAPAPLPSPPPPGPGSLAAPALGFGATLPADHG